MTSKRSTINEEVCSRRLCIILSIISLVAAAVLLSGCIAVPSTQISYSPGVAGGPPKFDLKAPKNSKIDGLEYTRSNNVVALRIRHYEASNDPAVISATAAGQVDMINAIGDKIIQAGKEGAAMMATGGASSVVGSSRPVGAPRRPPATNQPPANP